MKTYSFQVSIKIKFECFIKLYAFALVYDY